MSFEGNKREDGERKIKMPAVFSERELEELKRKYRSVYNRFGIDKDYRNKSGALWNRLVDYRKSSNDEAGKMKERFLSAIKIVPNYTDHIMNQFSDLAGNEEGLDEVRKALLLDSRVSPYVLVIDEIMTKIKECGEELKGSASENEEAILERIEGLLQILEKIILPEEYIGDDEIIEIQTGAGKLIIEGRNLKQ